MTVAEEQVLKAVDWISERIKLLGLMEDASLVHIGVRKKVPPDKSGVQYELGIFPDGSGKTHAHYRTSNAHHEERPRRVLWIAHGLERDMKIEIRPKKGVEQLFERESCDILHATGWAECGIARKPGTWEYSIQLFVGDRKDALLDPDVIIHPDP